MSTSTTPAVSARQLSRRRRRASWARGWRQFRVNRAGMAGLVVLAFFILVAVFAPLLADPEGLEVTKATGGVLEPPSSEFWLGTDDNGRSVLTLLIWGARISLFVGLMATLISMVIGTVIGLLSGYFGGWTGRDPVPVHRVDPGDPVPAAGDRAGQRAGPVAVQHRDRDRGDLLAGHRAADPQPDPVHQGAAPTSSDHARSAPATRT